MVFPDEQAPLHGEQLIDLAEVRTLPRIARLRGGKGISMPSLYRYIHHGIRGHRLETARLGNRRLTSAEAVDRFITRTSGGEHAPPPAPTPAQRSAARTKAETKFRSETRRRS